MNEAKLQNAAQKAETGNYKNYAEPIPSLREVVQDLPKRGTSKASGRSDLNLYDGNTRLPDIYAPEYADIVNEGLTVRPPELIETEFVKIKSPDESQFVKVKSNLKPKKDDWGHVTRHVAIFERNAVHQPDGQLIITDEKTHTVARTKAVCDAILEGRLIVVED